MAEARDTQSDVINIDLNNVSRSDSAGVALLIEWIRQAQKNNKTIQFHNIPKQMRDIATVTGVDKMLAI
jgi:phospholipid transport system transporter-binding protein